LLLFAISRAALIGAVKRTDLPTEEQPVENKKTKLATRCPIDLIELCVDMAFSLNKDFDIIKNTIDFQSESYKRKTQYHSLRDAIANGNLANLEWLWEKINVLTFQIAARYRNLDIMKWLKRKCCPFNEFAFEEAALHGILENMIWLKENGCPMNEKTFEEAATNADLRNMMWLKKYGCPMERHLKRL
jgi:hypothetical protein